jgi:hypothetical protein
MGEDKVARLDCLLASKANLENTFARWFTIVKLSESQPSGRGAFL